jgi:hypothetical protein
MFPKTLDNRYFQEDIRMSLVMSCSLREFLDFLTPACKGIVQMGEVMMGINYSD